MRSRSSRAPADFAGFLLSGVLVMALALAGAVALPQSTGDAVASDLRRSDLRSSDRYSSRSDFGRRHKPDHSQYRGQYRNQYRGQHGSRHVDEYRYGHDARQAPRHDRRRSGIVVGGDLPTHVPGIGTYSGSISAYRDRGNGVYLYRDGTGSPARDAFRLQQGPRIVTPGGGDAQCSNESGVCVIRPGY